MFKVLFNLTFKQNFPENIQFHQNQMFFKKSVSQEWLGALVLSAHYTTDD